MIRAELTKAKAHVTPTSLHCLAEAIDQLVAFGRAFDLLVNGNPETIEALSSTYGAALGDLPEDLLVEAVVETQAKWKWPRMPLPADIKCHVADEFSARLSILFTLERALARLTKQVTQRKTVAIGAAS